MSSIIGLIPQSLSLTAEVDDHKSNNKESQEKQNDKNNKKTKGEIENESAGSGTGTETTEKKVKEPGTATLGSASESGTDLYHAFVRELRRLYPISVNEPRTILINFALTEIDADLNYLAEVSKKMDFAKIEQTKSEEALNNSVKSLVAAAIAVAVASVTLGSDKSTTNAYTFIPSLGPLVVAIYLMIRSAYLRSTKEIHQLKMEKSMVGQHVHWLIEALTTSLEYDMNHFRRRLKFILSQRVLILKNEKKKRTLMLRPKVMGNTLFFVKCCLSCSIWCSFRARQINLINQEIDALERIIMFARVRSLHVQKKHEFPPSWKEEYLKQRSILQGLKDYNGDLDEDDDDEEDGVDDEAPDSTKNKKVPNEK